LRALAILATSVTLAVSAAPIASAGAPPKSRPATIVGGIDAVDSLVTSVAVKSPSSKGASGFGKVIDHAGNSTEITDGTSNTLAVTVVTEEMSATHSLMPKSPGILSMDHRI
jgi:hypothetical protein